MRVLIVGAGIGGVAAAIALEKEGHEPIVLEQAPRLEFVGQGINLGANAIKALRYLGAVASVQERAVRTRGWAYHGLDDGALQLTVPIGDRYGGEWYVSTHRADLLDALLGQLSPGAIRLGSRVTAIEERPDGIRVELTGGKEVFGDLLVGADGVKSVVRNALFGDADSEFSNFVAWRSVLPNEAAPKVVSRQELRLWSGSARFFVMYPIRNDLVNASAYVPADTEAAESWSAAGDGDELRAAFSGACSEVQLALESLRDPLLTGIYVRDPLTTWVTDRVALLGDAAHAMGPFSGSGGGVAMEDAVTLAVCLRGVREADAATTALKEYDRRRVPRMTRLQIDARTRLTTLNDKDPMTPAARAGTYAGMMTLDPYSELEFRWLYEHDAAAAAEQPLVALGLDSSNPMQRPEAQRAFDLWRRALTFRDHAGAWRGRRAGYERFLLNECPAPASAVVAEGEVGGVPVIRVSMPGATTDRIVMHLHGGGFMLGSARAAVEVAARIGHVLSCQVVVPDYRLAPEHPHPAAIDDVVAVYRGLVDEPTQRDIVITAEDAGGALAVHVGLWARDEGRQPPRAMLIVSPFCDLTVSSNSLAEAGSKEPWMDRQFATNLAASYIHKADPRSPAVSPVLADLNGLPPLFIAAASDEALIDDARNLAQACRGGGPTVESMEVEDSVHSFLLFDFLPEAHDVLERFWRFAGTGTPEQARGVS